jgi:hypothetical protein
MLAWLLVSLATAALAHVLIEAIGTLGASGDAYAEHAHGAVAPVAIGALGLVGAFLLRSAVGSLGRSLAIDPVVLLARRFGAMPPLVPIITVAVGGFATLVAMEFTEQLSELGRIEGIADALGGNALVGLAIVVGVAVVVTLVGLRCAGTLLEATVATVGALYAWIVAKALALIDGPAVPRRRRAPCHGATATQIARTRGLRAPPPAIV